MKNHLNILPKLASFDLKCSKMRWRLGTPLGELTTLPRPPNRKRQRAFGARHSLFRVHFYISIPLSGPPYGIPGSATVCLLFHMVFSPATTPFAFAVLLFISFVQSLFHVSRLPKYKLLYIFNHLILHFNFHICCLFSKNHCFVLSTFIFRQAL